MFQLLDFDRPTQREQWLRLWQSVPSRSPYLHPSYLGMLRAQGERAICLTYSWRTGALLFPLAVRPVPTTLGRNDLLDAHTPIGYSGGFVAGERSEAGEEEAWEVFATSLRDLKIVSVFLRLLPIADGALVPPWQPVYRSVKPNVIVSTRERLDDIWRRYAHKVRKNVKRGERENVRVEFGVTKYAVSQFIAIYRETMERVEADEAVKFSEAQLGPLLASMSDRCLVAVAYSEDEAVSAELLLRSEAYLHSFLGGTVRAGFEKRANDYLKHEVCRYASSKGLDGYFLGGGFRADDGIYRYKLSFAPDGEIDYHTLGYVLRRDDYELLAANSGLEADYFPAYRAREAVS